MFPIRTFNEHLTTSGSGTHTKLTGPESSAPPAGPHRCINTTEEEDEDDDDDDDDGPFEAGENLTR